MSTTHLSTTQKQKRAQIEDFIFEILDSDYNNIMSIIHITAAIGISSLELKVNIDTTIKSLSLSNQPRWNKPYEVKLTTYFSDSI